MSKRLIFMGTPDFAVPALKKLHQTYTISTVVTQPDRRRGRGRKFMPPPVKQFAESVRIPVLQPHKMGDIQAALKALAPDVIIVAAFGHILRNKVLNLPEYGCLNIHASLLPRWRGASPVTAAIRAGDIETGVTIMHMDRGLDTGPIVSRRAVPITLEHTGGSLTDELAALGSALIIDTLPYWFARELETQVQDETLATLAPKLHKHDGLINWKQSTIAVERHVRAYHPWPSAFTIWHNKPLKIISVRPYLNESIDLPPGSIFKLENDVAVATADGAVRLDQIQPPNKRTMATRDFINGAQDFIGSQL